MHSSEENHTIKEVRFSGEFRILENFGYFRISTVFCKGMPPGMGDRELSKSLQAAQVIADLQYSRRQPPSTAILSRALQATRARPAAAESARKI